ncbi:MAG: hypothetical protein QXU75_08335 [Candidatus Methanomethylicaceae archaeon]
MATNKSKGNRRRRANLIDLRREEELLYLYLSILHKRAKRRITEHYREPRTIAFM